MHVLCPTFRLLLPALALTHDLTRYIIVMGQYQPGVQVGLPDCTADLV